VSWTSDSHRRPRGVRHGTHRPTAPWPGTRPSLQWLPADRGVPMWRGVRAARHPPPSRDFRTHRLGVGIRYAPVCDRRSAAGRRAM